MFTVLLVIYLLAAVAIIGLVLIQQGKGRRHGSLHSVPVASNTVFGAGGSGNFLTRMTAIFATVFFVISLVLGNMSTHKTESQWVDPSQGQVIQQAGDTVSEAPAKSSDEIPH
ncbi:preprotein translocase subunit SecG [Vibrio metoecus]|uniref:Protein-export membrane protein SecG n=1 Tax=Vibrio metoecus TaxID=1481663 RepID=A0ABR4RZL8_VIBMT|nr:preprotein translocase subunit SecG [Vibrio metoecus]